MRFPSKYHEKISINISTLIWVDQRKDLSQSYRSTRYLTISCMSYILVSNGVSQGQTPPRPQSLKTRHNEIHWSNVYIHHNRWSKDGSYQKLFSALVPPSDGRTDSVIHLKDTDQLDISIIHGDGSNTMVKKGVQASVIVDINTRKVTRNSP